MKKKYEKPRADIDRYEVNEQIAACAIKVTFGPIEMCKGFGSPGDDDEVQFSAKKRGIPLYPFYDAYTCQCYTTAPENTGYFTS